MTILVVLCKIRYKKFKVRQCFFFYFILFFLLQLNKTEPELEGQCQLSLCYFPSGVVGPKAVGEGGVWVEVACVVGGAWWKALGHQDLEGVE